MSITKSYNKHTNTYYAYETTYVWDDSLQKKVQKRVCIGKYDPLTGEIIPNAKRGRPSRKPEALMETKTAQISFNIKEANQAVSEICLEMDKINQLMTNLLSRFHALEQQIALLQDHLFKNQ